MTKKAVAIEISKLRKAQAGIRNLQRRRLDIIHAMLHDHKRHEYRHDLGAKTWHTDRRGQATLIQQIHEEVHAFMNGFDEAVMIHERMAVLEGRDPKEVAKMLLPVRTMGTDHLE